MQHMDDNETLVFLNERFSDLLIIQFRLISFEFYSK